VSREIRIPFQHPLSPDDPILDVVTWARKSDPDADEQRIVEAIAFKALERGTTRAADLLSELEEAGPIGRRRIVDEARKSAGLPTIGEVEAERAFEMRNAGLRPGRTDGKAPQQCPHSSAVSSTPEGALRPTHEKRWHRDRHRHLAEPGDLDPPDDLLPRIDFATMKLLPSKAVEEQERRQWEHTREELRKRDEAKRQEAERLRRLETEYEAAHPPVFFQGVPPQ
jgi:hypothetical protein